MWSELIRTADQMHSMIFPRLLAIAERAWHKGSWEDLADEGERKRAVANDWVKFANTLGYKELGRLDKMGLAYHVPSPKARFVITRRQVTINQKAFLSLFKCGFGFYEHWENYTIFLSKKKKKLLISVDTNLDASLGSEIAW